MCKLEKCLKDFAPNQLSNYQGGQNKTLRCITCFTCTQCQAVKTAKQFTGSADACVSCTAEQSGLKCASCQASKPKVSYDANILNNHLHHKRKLLCIECQDNGYHLQNFTAYTCKNGCKYGERKFDKAAFAQYKKTGKGPLTCASCAAKERQRYKDISAKLKTEGAWKCTCKKELHQPKCQLHQRYAGEIRWEGKNVGVTQKDLEFMAKYKKR